MHYQSIQTHEGITLLASPPLKRLTNNLHDLITIALETYIKTRGSSFALTKLHYVSDEKHEDRFSMHFDALAKDLEQNVNTPLSLTFTVSIGDYKCFPQL